MKNPLTGEIKEVKVGFSWTLFLWSGLFGLPLFLRRLYVWGAIFLSLWIVNAAAIALGPKSNGELVSNVMGFIYLGLVIFVGIRGNEMTAKNYLETGWVFLEPDSELTKMAKMRWGISV